MMKGPRVWRTIWAVALCLCLCVLSGASLVVGATREIAIHDGAGNLAEADRLFQLNDLDAAATHYWHAVLHHGTSAGAYELDQAFHPFLKCYAVQGKISEAYMFIAEESIGRGQGNMAKMYLEQVLHQDPTHERAQELWGQVTGETPDTPPQARQQQQQQQQQQQGFDHDADDHQGETSVEELYEIGAKHFADKEYELCAEYFELSCKRSGMRIGPSCANAVYCRSYYLDWGFNGTTFEEDMQRIASLTRFETDQRRSVDGETGLFSWAGPTSVHPHMMLAYPVESMLKRYSTESTAFKDEFQARIRQDMTVQELPPDLPYDQNAQRLRFLEEAKDPDFKIKVGFVGSGFNSKAVLYLSQDMFRFFDKDKFEVHILSVGPPDKPGFIQYGMRGVDWRERVKLWVDHFHDVRSLKDDHIEMARFVYNNGLHILIEWDGYARQGERAQGLFALRPSPVQILHQEFLGTSGAQFVDYLITDRVTSPERLEHLYVEKLIYMPNHFFSKGHAMQAEVKNPTYDYKPVQVPYKLGTGTPAENRCMAPPGVGPSPPSFVFCNFNKFLKNNPETVRSWIRILREVPGSMLCLLENPAEGIPYLRKFIHEAAGTSTNNNDPESFVEGDGDDLNSRIHFIPWQANPFDHQMRNQDFCNAMLDSFPYNGHTVAQDSLYGGVPIVTRSDGSDMCALVSTSANVVLDLEDLNAYEGPRQYEDIAIRLGNDPEFYKATRTRLIDTCLQRNPMHPYWDVPRYVKNFENGLTQAFDRYLAGKPPAHIDIVEDERTKRGSFDVDLTR
eukprot:scaffold47140_cov51-Attheya_sp.AAC.6